MELNLAQDLNFFEKLNFNYRIGFEESVVKSCRFSIVVMKVVAVKEHNLTIN